MARFAGKYCNVLASGSGTLTNNMTTTDVGGLHTTYQVTNANQRVFDPRAAVTVKKNGTIITDTTTYVVDRLFGRVTFFTPLLGTDSVSISATWLAMTSVAGAESVDMVINKQTIDATTFASLGDTERAHSLRDVNGTVDRFYQADGLFFTALEAGSVMVIEFWRNQTTVDWRTWAIFTKSDIKASTTTLVGQTISWDSEADADGRSVSFA